MKNDHEIRTNNIVDQAVWIESEEAVEGVRRVAVDIEVDWLRKMEGDRELYQEGTIGLHDYREKVTYLSGIVEEEIRAILLLGRVAGGENNQDA